MGPLIAAAAVAGSHISSNVGKRSEVCTRINYCQLTEILIFVLEVSRCKAEQHAL